MKSAILFTFLGIFVLSANADPITTSVSCTTAGQTTVSTSSCSGGASNPYSKGTASATYSISGNTLTINLATFAGFVPGPVNTDASAYASLNLNVYAANYVGAAYVSFNGSVLSGGNTYGEDQVVTFQMTPGYSINCVGSDYCSPATGPNCGLGHPGDGTSPPCDTTQPVALQLGGGNLFNLSIQSRSDEGSSFGDNGYVQGDVAGTISFYEADGVTPLDITLAPEPGSIALAGLGLVVCVMGLLKRRKARLASLSGSEAATELNLKKLAPPIMVAFFSVAMVTANADPLSTSVSCTTASQTVVSSSGCSGPNYVGTAYATYNISGNSITLNLVTLASNPVGPAATQTDVSSNASLNINLYSANYVGAGYAVLYVDAAPGGSTYGMESYVLFQTTPGFSTFCVGESCTTSGPNCGGPPNEQNPPCQTTQPFAIELGGGNLFNVDAQLTALADNNGYTSGVVDGTISFYEADGVTPLDITLAPEPGSIALACLGLSLCGVAVAKRRKVN